MANTAVTANALACGGSPNSMVFSAIDSLGEQQQRTCHTRIGSNHGAGGSGIAPNMKSRRGVLAKKRNSAVHSIERGY